MAILAQSNVLFRQKTNRIVSFDDQSELIEQQNLLLKNIVSCWIEFEILKHL